MKPPLLYVGYYDTESNKHEKRNYVLAASNKMTYICSAINQTGRNVEIVSASGSLNKRFCSAKKLQLTEGTSLKLFASIGSGNVLKRMIHRFSLKAQLFFYLLKHTQAGQPVLVYHSLGYMNMIRLLKKIKKFRLVLEVEEIYSDVTGNAKCRAKEMALFSAADAFVLPTELLNTYINPSDKPHVVIYGTYRVEPDLNVCFNDDKLHLLYAGTLDPRKGGAQSAVAAAQYLSDRYHVHILGFGSEKDVQQIKESIAELRTKSEAEITYDGVLSGEDYIKFVQSCHVGFSTQTPEGAYNETSFPSKVLSYMANGLRVVSVRLNVLEQAKIGNLLYYYDNNAPSAIAAAVKEIDFSTHYDSRSTIHALDEAFRLEIDQLLEG